jgi:Protein of unknown function (DUF938)
VSLVTTSIARCILLFVYHARSHVRTHDPRLQLNTNMIHISPWTATEGLFAAAGRLLRRGGYLFTYGPYKVDGEFTTESNRQFDLSLRGRDARWGLRDLADVQALAAQANLSLVQRHSMPANNFMLAFRKR